MSDESDKHSTTRLIAAALAALALGGAGGTGITGFISPRQPPHAPAAIELSGRIGNFECRLEALEKRIDRMDRR